MTQRSTKGLFYPLKFVKAAKCLAAETPIGTYRIYLKQYQGIDLGYCFTWYSHFTENCYHSPEFKYVSECKAAAQAHIDDELAPILEGLKFKTKRYTKG